MEKPWGYIDVLPRVRTLLAQNADSTDQGLISGFRLEFSLDGRSLI
jgi:hypothetical protein